MDDFSDGIVAWLVTNTKAVIPLTAYAAAAAAARARARGVVVGVVGWVGRNHEGCCIPYEGCCIPHEELCV